MGYGKGAGFSVNVAFTHEGYGDAEYASAFKQIIMPIAQEFNPELVLVSWLHTWFIDGCQVLSASGLAPLTV